MMMKMLAAGGLPIFQDGLRQADADNPKGYYEAEKVKNLAQDASWLPMAAGHAIKIISSLVTWVIYGLYLLVSRGSEWRGRRSQYILIVGAIAVAITTGLHGFSRM